MRSNFKVLWTEVAEEDLVGIVGYIAEDSIPNAKKVFKKIKDKVQSLDQLPERGRIVPELRDHGVALYRELIVTPWRVIYRISERKVYVFSVIDSRQDVEDLLLKKLIMR